MTDSARRHPPMVLTYDEIDRILDRECDWGGCGEESTALRWSPDHGWLPVCTSCSRTTHPMKGATK